MWTSSLEPTSGCPSPRSSAKPPTWWTGPGRKGLATTPPWETRNVEEALFQGLEADVSLPGPLGTLLTLGGSVLSVDAKESAGYRSKYALRPLRERIIGKIRRDFGTTLTLGINGQRGRRGGEEAFSRVDAHAGFRWGSSRIYLDVTNLLDSSYPDITGALAPGRSLVFGLKWRIRSEPLPTASEPGEGGWPLFSQGL